MSVNSLLELAPPTEKSTVGAGTSGLGFVVDAENENGEPVSENSLMEMAPPTKKSTVAESTYNLGSEVDAEKEIDE